MNTIKCVLFTGLTSLAIALAPAAIASPPYLDPVPAEETEDTVTLTGTVKEKTEKELTLKEAGEQEKETRIQLTDDTKYLKDGQPATAADVTVGARVSVKAKKAFLGRHDAIEVTIQPAQTGPQPGPSPTN
jgi:hypothetical protein